ncbi:hypothetical protein OCV99_01165 [Dorea acetigenes]|jgi:hypothetical protein|uniref:Uncharacterized protein n=1 Tax=Dorea acetigenes TaxID=2981787 RepID=A0ABT2RIG0_9FIRM|nr:hypothetical protein [Dorea acetigenes]MCU6685175.1 hypothetical protein [Dorea acetigenes]SCI39323.1 Uncharacterised protein [uncultured Clostridium sp.]
MNEKNMTELSQYNYNEAAGEDRSIQEAIAFLEHADMRTPWEKIEKFSHGKELQKLLVEGLLEHDPSQKRESVARRVRGWMKYTMNQTIKKKDAIELCFILGLSVEEADEFVALVSEEGLHWRSPDEIVYIFALKQGMSYQEAQKLNEEMKRKLSTVRESREPAQDSFTPVIRAEVAALRTREELEDYLTEAVPRLGRWHNNAYKLFMEMLEILEHPELDEIERRAEVFEEERLTARDITREYFYGDHVLYAKEQVRAGKKKEDSGKEKLTFTEIQKNISSGWPDDVALSKMRNRKMDVTRKVLILLFLATDPGSLPEDEEDLEWEPSGEESFEDLYCRLNDMLLQCGYRALDPRSPFDWMILYCIHEGDMVDVSARLRAMIRAMFGEKE